MATFHAGNTGTATINGVELAVTGWSVAPTVDIARFRNSKTAGFTKKETTFRECTGTIEVDWDFDLLAFTAAPFGTTVTNLKLFLHGTGGQFWLFPSAIITGTPQRVDVDGKIVTSIAFENDGTFTAPV